ncbi:sporulation membrane protein YtrI [Bacillus sp. FJAT-50079]|uniref:sporulation membrane protein YtrI n=1 Tax=Bacillus sp. FJAT-50079 TaxID=2833577 RepID=UPI001BC93457|nr:sporulation membrane protein YtrI [Bacillus sp. FJAT-50079]MBS4208779.1 sporulation protein [Bacillus sp. FJAT-50079]
MRIPPLYHKPGWQRFLAGAAVGGCISWLIFLYMFGSIQEKSSFIINKQANDIKELQEDINIWKKEYDERNKENADLLTIQQIEVKLVRYEKYNITDKQSIIEIEEAIKEDLKSLIAKDISSVFKNKEIVKKTIENKIVNVNSKKYQIVVSEIYFYTTLSIEVEIKLAG